VTFTAIRWRREADVGQNQGAARRGEFRRLNAQTKNRIRRPEATGRQLDVANAR